MEHIHKENWSSFCCNKTSALSSTETSGQLIALFAVIPAPVFGLPYVSNHTHASDGCRTRELPAAAAISEASAI